MILFKQKPLVNLLNESRQRTEAAVRYKSEKEFFSFPKEQLIDIFMRDENIEHLKINLQDRTSDLQMVPIPAENFPPGTDVQRGQSYPCARVKYIYNKPKNYNLLQYLPTGAIFNKNVEYSVGSEKLYIYYQTRYGNENLSDAIKKEVVNFMVELHEEIKEIENSINNEIDAFQTKLRIEIGNWIDERIAKKAETDNRNNDLNNF